ncbi:hypothetical protein FACS1894172_19490 [Spirochaetia bacterium]|nr:hypothetical protein FACS1894172_19490 [Spirochaetia bacterium]
MSNYITFDGKTYTVADYQILSTHIEIKLASKVAYDIIVGGHGPGVLTLNGSQYNVTLPPIALIDDLRVNS